MSQHRIELTIVGQKFAFTTSPEHEASLRSAVSLVNDQLEAALLGNNRSIERAAIMTAIKLAGDLQSAQKNISTPEQPVSSDDSLAQLQAKLESIENTVDLALKTISLPGAPRSIVP